MFVFQGGTASVVRLMIPHGKEKNGTARRPSLPQMNGLLIARVAKVQRVALSRDLELIDAELSLKTEMAPDSAGVRSGLVSLSDRFESSSGIYSPR